MVRVAIVIQRKMARHRLAKANFKRGNGQNADAPRQKEKEMVHRRRTKERGKQWHAASTPHIALVVELINGA